MVILGRMFLALIISFALLCAIHIDVIAQQPDDFPRVLHTETPPYPLMAVRSRLGGLVSIQATLSPDGTVTSAIVLDGQAMLAHGAAESTRKWLFESAPSQAERTIRLQFDFVGPQPTEGADRVDTSYESPGLFRLVYFQSTIRRIARVDGEIPIRYCDVHAQPTHIDVLPIRYGLSWHYTSDGTRGAKRHVARQEKYRQAHEVLFPNANVYARGGCNVQFEDRAETYYCPQCRSARNIWIAHHTWYREYEMTDDN